MKKTLILPLLLLSNAVFPVFAQTIKSVEIFGNKTVSEQKILSVMRMKQGTELNSEVLDADIKELGETGFFHSVRYETQPVEGGEIIIKLYFTENPAVEDIQFKGNRSFRTGKLKDFLGIKKGDLFNEAQLLKGIAEIERQYKDRGFHLVNLDADVQEKDGKATISIVVEEDKKSYVREISVKGNTAFSASRIKKSMKIKERSMPFKKGSFKEEVFEKDIAALKSRYQDSGFIDVEISSRLLPHKKGGMLIEIDIEEGTQYFLGEVFFEGNLIAEEKELRDMLLLKKKGEVFNKGLSDRNRQSLSAFYMDRGYIKAEIAEIPLPSDSPEVINLMYAVKPGEVYRAGEIKIKGNTKTKDKVIRRELKIEPADIITAGRIKKSFNNLFDLNYFEKINIYPEFVDETDTADVIVEVEEKAKTGMFLIGGGYSSVDDFIGMISIQQTNFDIANPPSFTGGGQNIELSLELGTEARNYRLSFTEPYFLDKPVWIGPDIYRTRRAWTDYTEQRTGFNFRIGRRWENVSLGFALKTEEIELSDIDLASLPSLAGQEGEKRKNSVTATLVHNTLNSRRSPSSGNLGRLSLESSGGIFQGDVDFIKPVLENDFYRPLGKFVFHSRTYAGFIQETGETEEIPVYERFFGGGIGTVRGYKERSFGPQDDVTGKTVGGKALFAQNFELIYPLYQDILKGVVFFDAGNVWDSFGEFSDLRKGVGVGVKVVVPILNAPIEIYYGYALDKKPADSSSRIHIGMSFGF